MDYVTEAVNLVLERLDRICDALERLAAAAEQEDPE